MIKIIKNNKLLFVVAIVYMVLFVFQSDKAMEATGNSVYYLIEMFEVLPVIFLLTIAIEVLIPKEWIMKHFGENSGIQGNLIALLLGSISAGPIYAAFPICKTLLSKGASVTNIVIVLSSWAVIKIPMLANEAKFLGISFMGIRWILTVIAILIMAWIMGKVIHKSELDYEDDDRSTSKVFVNRDYCIGCGICARLLPEVYEVIDKKASIKTEHINMDKKDILVQTMEKCQTKAISVNLDDISGTDDKMRNVTENLSEIL